MLQFQKIIRSFWPSSNIEKQSLIAKKQEDDSILSVPQFVKFIEDNTIMRIMTKDIRQDCAICGHPFNRNNTIRLLPCRHAYHIKCIDNWFFFQYYSSGTPIVNCPLCKCSLTDEMV